MDTLSVKKYNEMQTKKWSEDNDKALKEGRHVSMLPHLNMYIFNRTYGFVAFTANCAMWAKTKKEVITNFKRSYGDN